jgi:hypothetical protein
MHEPFPSATSARGAVRRHTGLSAPPAMGPAIERGRMIARHGPSGTGWPPHVDRARGRGRPPAMCACLTSSGDMP